MHRAHALCILGCTINQDWTDISDAWGKRQLVEMENINLGDHITPPQYLKLTQTNFWKLQANCVTDS